MSLTTPTITAPTAGATVSGAFVVTCTASVSSGPLTLTAVTGSATAVVGAASVTSTPVAMASTPSDDFNDNVINTTLWTVTQPSAFTAVTESSQRLNIAIKPSAAALGVLQTKNTALLNLTGKRHVVQLVQAPTAALTYAIFGLNANGTADDQIQWSIYSNAIECYKKVGSTFTLIGPGSTAYNAAVHKYLAIAHDSSSGLVLWQYRTLVTDPWTTFASTAASGLGLGGSGITGMLYTLTAGQDGTLVSPGTAIWDNVNINVA